jgi:hypothetical protein
MNRFFYYDIILSKDYISEILTDLSKKELLNLLKNKASLEKKYKENIMFDCFELKINDVFYLFRTSTFLDDSKIKKSINESIDVFYNKIKLIKNINTMIIKSEDII